MSTDPQLPTDRLLPFYHPTTVLVVDDDPTFLESFAYWCARKVRCITARSPGEAEQLLRASSTEWSRRLATTLPRPSSEGSIDGGANSAFEVPIAGIREACRDPARMDTIAVCVVDFAMPAMTGVELCRRLVGLPVKRILLTGKTGDQTAVSAFNEHLIDHFLIKQDVNVTDKLLTEIARLQRGYFADATASLAPLASAGEFAFLSEPAVVAKVLRLFNDLDVIEHYVSAAPKGIVARTRAGESFLIVVQDRETARAHAEIAETVAAPEGLRNALASDLVVAAFPTESGYFEPDVAENWGKFLFPAERFASLQDYRIAIVRGPVVRDFANAGAC